MKTLQIILIVFFTANIAFAQYPNKYIVLNNGETIECKKFKNTGNFLEVKTQDSKEPTSLRMTEVLGYFSEDDNVMYYKEKNLYKSKLSNQYYDFYERVAEGDIKVYYYATYVTDYSPNGTGISRTIAHLFAKKNDELIEVSKSINSQRNKKRYVNNLLGLIDDDPKLMFKVNDLGFKYSNENVLSLIKDYNLSRYVPSIENESTTSKLVFYRQSDKAKEDLKVSFEDGNILDMALNSVENIELPTESLIKVCVSYQNNESCILIKPTHYFEKYYKVVSNKKGRLSILNRSKQKAKFDISNIKSTRKSSH